MIIDIHTHCFPQDMAPQVVPYLAGLAGINPYLGGTVDELKSSMKKAGIDYSVIQCIATKPQQTRTVNDWAVEMQGDGIFSFGSIHPDFPRWKEELKRLKEAGIKGIKLHPDYQDFFIDEERMFEIYERVFQLDLIILFHAGLDIGLPPPYHCTPLRLLKLINRFPEGKIIAAHMGGYAYWNQVEEMLIGEDIYFDTSYSFNDLGKEKMSRLIKLHGPEKILFGSDSPWTDQSQEVINIMNLDLSEEEKKAVMGGNGARLLDI